jgi:rhodanese-related sulfurtransferase
MIVLAVAGLSRPCKFIGEDMFPEITVTELDEKLKSDEKFILLDVRELSELKHAKVTDSRLEVMPMSRLAREGVTALSESIQSQEVPVFVLCHHGNRSMQVTMWLSRQGYKNVINVSGGIDAYARQVDSSVGFY